MKKAKISPSALSDQALELIAARFKVLSEPTRLRLLIALETGEKNVTELVEATGAAQANVSRQLQALSGSGLLGRRKEGLNVFYYIADPTIFDLCGHVCASLQKRIAHSSRIFEPSPGSSGNRVSARSARRPASR
jgi:ArsR family transcriptional regulator